MGFFGRFFRKQPTEFERFSMAKYYQEQIDRIRRGEPVMWLPGTPTEILVASEEIDRLNAELNERESR